MPSGAIFGASDKDGGHPARDAVTPQDIAATIYQTLGIPPDTEIRDPRQGRPYVLSTGTPIRALMG
jgi:hypothetical protein